MMVWGCMMDERTSYVLQSWRKNGSLLSCADIKKRFAKRNWGVWPQSFTCDFLTWQWFQIYSEFFLPMVKKVGIWRLALACTISKPKSDLVSMVWAQMPF